ncbi:MAG: protein kinase [Polyangiaceae bacterium]
MHALRTDLQSLPPVAPLTAGSYLLGEEIARGGYGTVHRARHADTGLPAAVKLLHADLFEDPDAAPRFEREASVVLALSHPGIVRTHSWGRTADGRPYLVMELLQGESLADRLRARGRLPIEEALAILDPLASALAAVHAAGIVHRDIKPPNIFLAEDRPEGSVVLLDFGLAKLLATEGPALTSSRVALGTIPYMAPEQVRCEPLDPRTDVYALAAVTYTMLTGSPPFGARPTGVLRQIHARARPPLPSEQAPLDSALDAPLLAALSRDPEARPPSAAAFIASLRGALAGRIQTIKTSPSPAPLPTRPAPAAPETHATPAAPTTHATHATPATPAAPATPAPSRSSSAPDDSPAAETAIHPRAAASAPLAVAVFARASLTDEAASEHDEVVAEALESTLPILRTELAAAGLIPVQETTSTLLALSERPLDTTAADDMLSACARALRQVMSDPHRSRLIALSIAVHTGPLDRHPSGALLQTGLLDPRTWAPPATQGIVASHSALGESTRKKEPIPGQEGYFQIA